MLKCAGVLCLSLALADSVGAGEIVFTNGSRVAGDLANEVLLVSTGADVIEVLPEQVVRLTREEIRLKDGRVIRGTIVGGQLKARTSVGELAIKVDELRVFESDDVVSERPMTPAAPSPPIESPAAPADAPGAPTGPGQVVEGAKRIGQGVEATLAGVSRTVTDAADRLHDGAKKVGSAIRDTVKSIGRAIKGVF
ncbi:MAG: hypothetical protein ACRELA_19430 [Candidatus Rokuibacteriota bacterium]